MSRPLWDKDSFHVSDSLVGGIQIRHLLQVSRLACLGSYARRKRPKMRLLNSKLQLLYIDFDSLTQPEIGKLSSFCWVVMFGACLLPFKPYFSRVNKLLSYFNLFRLSRKLVLQSTAWK